MCVFVHAEMDEIKRETKRRAPSESDFATAPKRRSTRVRTSCLNYGGCSDGMIMKLGYMLSWQVKSKGREPVDIFQQFKKYVPSVFKLAVCLVP